MKWISVEDELPKRGEHVLVYMANESDELLRWAEAEYDGKYFDTPYYGQTLGYHHVGVTHWALPDPPK